VTYPARQTRPPRRGVRIAPAPSMNTARQMGLSWKAITLKLRPYPLLDVGAFRPGMVIALGVGIALVAGACAGDKRTASHVPAAIAAKAVATESTLAVHFDAVVEPRVGPSRFPPWLAQRLIHDASHHRRPAQIAAEPFLATFLATSPGTRQVWLVPGAGGACLEVVGSVGHAVHGACAPTSSLEAGMLMLRLDSDHAEMQVIGVAADTNKHVSLMADNTLLRVPVTNNVWLATVPRTTTLVIQLRDSGGRRRTFAILPR
jgi:hypothetical protein